MALDGFPNVPLGLFKGAPGGNASRQVRNVARPIVLCLLKNDGVFLADGFFSTPAVFRIERAGWYVASVLR
jgi:hypothetical protein